MIYLKLRQARKVVNHKRMERLYSEARLLVKWRKRKNIPIADRQPLGRPRAANQVWPYHAGCRTDNGKDICGRAMLTWAHPRGLPLLLIEPEKPNQNANIEPFNRRFNDECMNKHWFTSLPHASVLIESSRRDYNEE